MREMAFIHDVLQDASAYVRARYAERGLVAVHVKGDPNDLLTEVDLEVQRRIHERIQREFPGDALVGEEDGMNRLPRDSSVRCWILDPIDGTQNFVRALFPAFGVSLAFAADGALRAGGVALPMANDLFLAHKGGGAARNGRPIHVSTVARAAEARIEVDFSVRADRQDTLDRAAEIIRQTGQIRCHCSAVVALCSIACGDMDAFFHVTLNPWDYAAGQIIVEEAGGRSSRLDGSPLNVFERKQGVLITNGRLHEEFLSLIR